MGSTDHGAHVAKTCLAEVLASPGSHGYGDVQVQGPAVGAQILELPCSRVAGAHQDKHAAAGAAGALPGRLPGLAGPVWVQPHRVRVPNGTQAASPAPAGERASG